VLGWEVVIDIVGEVVVVNVDTAAFMNAPATPPVCSTPPIVTAAPPTESAVVQVAVISLFPGEGLSRPYILIRTPELVTTPPMLVIAWFAPATSQVTVIAEGLKEALWHRKNNSAQLGVPARISRAYVHDVTEELVPCTEPMSWI
jgi:hypothetical protein